MKRALAILMVVAAVACAKSGDDSNNNPAPPPPDTGTGTGTGQPQESKWTNVKADWSRGAGSPGCNVVSFEADSRGGFKYQGCDRTNTGTLTPDEFIRLNKSANALVPTLISGMYCDPVGAPGVRIVQSIRTTDGKDHQYLRSEGSTSCRMSESVGAITALSAILAELEWKYENAPTSTPTPVPTPVPTPTPTPAPTPTP